MKIEEAKPTIVMTKEEFNTVRYFLVLLNETPSLATMSYRELLEDFPIYCGLSEGYIKTDCFNIQIAE